MQSDWKLFLKARVSTGELSFIARVCVVFFLKTFQLCSFAGRLKDKLPYTFANPDADMLGWMLLFV